MKSFPLVSRRRLKAAITERDAALAERDVARAERGAARAECDVARAECDAARDERDAALGQILKAATTLVNTNNVASLTPVSVCRTHSEWKKFQLSDDFAFIQRRYGDIISAYRFDETWGIAGFSNPARQDVIFKVDMLGGGKRIGDEFYPNIRERLECPVTGLNDRQRLIAALVQSALSKRGATGSSVYCMEQVTPFFSWLTKKYAQLDIVGSEFLGDYLNPGQIVDGIRHENLQDLSFKDASLDLVISNDVMEHVPSPLMAFRELARVMREGSQALMTFPFSLDLDHSITRAEIINGELKHLSEPVYHGNPVSPDGSLVFTDFGWDIFDLVKQSGFKDVSLEIYHSILFGHLGFGLVFRLVR